MACAFRDETCCGRLEAALRKDAPPELIRTDEQDRRYFVGDPLVGYMRLCMSHHRRYDDPERVLVKRYSQSGIAAIKKSGYLGSERHVTSAIKALCQRWNINRGKPCTCGQHG